MAIAMRSLVRVQSLPPTGPRAPLDDVAQRGHTQDEAERFGGGLLNRIGPQGLGFASSVLRQ